MAQGKDWDLVVSVYPVSQHVVFIPCRNLFILHLAGLGDFLLDLLWVAAVQGAHGRQCFSALIRLEKTQKKLSGVLMVEMSRNWCYVM